MKYADIGTHFALCVSNSDAIYFDSFRLEHAPKEIRHFIGNKKIETNTCRMQASSSWMRRYFYNEFIDFVFAGKTLTYCTSLFSPYEFKKNDQIILNYNKDT